jgi:uncharacterized membrane protein
MEAVVGRVLRAGLAISVAVLAAGLALSLAGVAPAAADRVLRAGLLILMATPVARVVAATIEYGVERDWVFLSVTLLVLGVLGASLVAALRV